MKMMSLYDYLGRAAGPELGQQVATAAAKAGVKHEIREVSNTKYTGPIMLYPRSFLNLYFIQITFVYYYPYLTRHQNIHLKMI